MPHNCLYPLVQECTHKVCSTKHSTSLTTSITKSERRRAYESGQRYPIRRRLLVAHRFQESLLGVQRVNGEIRPLQTTAAAAVSVPLYVCSVPKSITRSLWQPSAKTCDRASISYIVDVSFSCAAGKWPGLKYAPFLVCSYLVECQKCAGNVSCLWARQVRRGVLLRIFVRGKMGIKN